MNQPLYPQSMMQQPEPQESSGIGSSLLKGGLLGGGVVAIFAVFGDKIADFLPFMRPFLEKMGVAKPKTPEAAAAPSPSPTATTTPEASAKPAPTTEVTPPSPAPEASRSPKKAESIIMEEDANGNLVPVDGSGQSAKADVPVTTGAQEEIITETDTPAPAPVVPDAIRKNWPANALPTMDASLVAAARASEQTSKRNKGNLLMPQAMAEDYKGKNFLGDAKANQKNFEQMTIAQARALVKANKAGQPDAIVNRVEMLLSDAHIASLNALELKQKTHSEGTWGRTTKETPLTFSTSTKMRDLPAFAGRDYLSKFLGGSEKTTPGIETFTLSLTAAEAKRMDVQAWQRMGLTPLQAQAWKQTVDTMLVDDLDYNKRPSARTTSVGGPRLDMPTAAAKRKSFTEMYENENIYQDVTPMLTPKQIVEIVQASTPSHDLTKQLRMVQKPTLNPLDHEPTLLDYKAQIVESYNKLTDAQKKTPIKALQATDETPQATRFMDIVRSPASATKQKQAAATKVSLHGVSGGDSVAGEVRPTRVAGVDGTQQTAEVRV